MLNHNLNKFIDIIIIKWSMPENGPVFLIANFINAKAFVCAVAAQTP